MTQVHVHHRAPARARLTLTLALTAVVLAIEVAGGLHAHSVALLSDAGHILTDISAQGLALLALVFAARPADTRRTYGYHRLEILSALVNGLALLAIAGLLFWESWRRLRHPVAVDVPVMIGTAALALGVNLVGAWVLRHTENLNARGAYLHMLMDVLASLAVLAGGAIMGLAHGLYFVDPILSALIAVIIVLSSIGLLRAAVDILLEAVPAEVDLARVSGDIARLDGVKDVHDLHIWTITSGMYALSAHVVVDERHAGPCDTLLTCVKEMLLREHRIAHSTLQVESVIYEHAEHVH